MGELLKDVYTTDYLTRVGRAVARQAQGFEVRRFVLRVQAGNWRELSFKQRVRCLSLALGEELPADYAKALEIVVRAAGEGFGSYPAVFFPDFVEVHGRAPRHRRRSLKALEVLTRYSTSEFAIRAFLADDLEGTMKQIQRWCRHESEHVRRLSSEGIRPRLPWASHLSVFKRDPGPILPILEALKTDSSDYVRRSVANNLNDISKDHPELALKVARVWAKGGTLAVRTAKHGLRTLLKRGDPRALALTGCDGRKGIRLVSLKLSRESLCVGGRLHLQAHMHLKKEARLRLEYALYFPTLRGTFACKVFKISERNAPAGDFTFKWQHSFVPLSTRTYRPGEYRLGLIVNGREERAQTFRLTPAYWVYMVRTQKNKLYTGVSTDPDRRLREHAGSSKGAKYFRSDPPVELVWREIASSRGEALGREAAIKRLSRARKEALLLRESPPDRPPRPRHPARGL